MSWLPCRCGYIFHDNTDFLSFKAHFRADQDTDDFFCQVEDILKNQKLSAEDKAHEILCVADFHYTNRILYQCPECGRLFVEDNDGHYHCFMPEPEETNHRLLESAEGENWKGMLHAEWTFPKPQWSEHSGYIIVNINGEERQYLEFDDYEALRKKFYDLFQILSVKKKIRSASLYRTQDKKREKIFDWSD